MTTTQLRTRSGIPVLESIERTINDQDDILKRWRGALTVPLNSGDAVAKLQKDLGKFKGEWYESNFMSHHQIRVLVQALRLACGNSRENMGQLLYRASEQVRVDPVLKAWAEGVIEGSQEAEERLDMGGLEKAERENCYRQMELFSYCDKTGVYTAISANVLEDAIEEMKSLPDVEGISIQVNDETEEAV